jgi:protein-disulfide reductase (glutathione)
VALALGGALTLGACVEPPQRNSDGGQARDAEADDAAGQKSGPKRTATIPADGWNERIAWRSLDEGLRESAQTGMPLMMVVHTSWCGNCQKLKRTFNSDTNLERLSEQFVMVHVDQDQYPEATLYGPDGQYIPRVMFLDEDGNVDQKLQNPNRPTRFRYFYTPQEDLVATMRQALDQHGNKS